MVEGPIPSGLTKYIDFVVSSDYSKLMPLKPFLRRKSFEIYKQVIELRKREFSYSEIRAQTGVAKSTINNWLNRAGMTLSKKHLEIQAWKRMENHEIGTLASKITRQRRYDIDIQKFIKRTSIYFNDPFFNYGLALFEAEGSKNTDCRFSNSDYRLIKTFVKFIEKYLILNRKENMSFSLYVHKSRKKDLEKILNFWSSKIGIEKTKMFIYWKRNKIVGRRDNADYVGQISVRVVGERILGSKLLSISDIILSQYQNK